MSLLSAFRVLVDKHAPRTRRRRCRQANLGVLCLLYCAGLGCTGDRSSGQPGAAGVSDDMQRNRFGLCNGVGFVCPTDAWRRYEDCVLSECKSELDAAYGGVAMPGVYRGACAMHHMCEESCGCTDIPCLEACGEPDAPCDTALAALAECVTGCNEPVCMEKPVQPVDPVQPIACVEPPSANQGKIPEGEFVGGCYQKADKPGGIDQCYMWSSAAISGATDHVASACADLGGSYCEWGCPAKNATGACYGQRTGVDEWNVYYNVSKTALADLRENCNVTGVWTDHYRGTRFTKP